MKKLLLILLFTPLLIFSQEKSTKIIKDKHQKKENKLERKNKKRASRQKEKGGFPKNQIGYIMSGQNPLGVNYFWFTNKKSGFYIDFRLGTIYMDHDFPSDLGENPYPINDSYTPYSDVFNVGYAFVMIQKRPVAIIGYTGLGISYQPTYTVYMGDGTQQSLLYIPEYNYYPANFNLGILIQNTTRISYLLGFDSTSNTVNFGLGWTW